MSIKKLLASTISDAIIRLDGRKISFLELLRNQIQEILPPRMAIFYPIILALGFFTSYTDIRFRKIRNKHLLVATIFGLLAYAYLMVTQKGPPGANPIPNLLLGIAIGALLYLISAWGAGDAKLFAIFCLLMPTERYSHLFLFPAITVFINIFLLSTFVMLLLALTRTLNNKVHLFNNVFSFRNLDQLLLSFLIVISLSWAALPILQILIPNSPYLLQVIILYICYHFLYKMVTRPHSELLCRTLFGFGLLARFLYQPSDFAATNAANILTKTILYAIPFHGLRIISTANSLDREYNKNIPFAPLLFLGTLLANTNFLNVTMDILRCIR